MTPPAQSRLFEALLGGRPSLDAALSEASARIAEIGRRKPRRIRSVTRDGVTVTQLYDYAPPGRAGATPRG